MPFFDTHAHLDQAEFDADREEVILRAVQAGVETILCVGVDAATSAAAVALAQRHPSIRAAVGIQPNSRDAMTGAELQRIVGLAGHDRVVALGETGLDRYWDTTPLPLQQDFFARHLRFSQDRDIPVIIHCRDARQETLATLRAAAARGPLRGVMHALSGDAAFAAECVELGLYLSFAGNATYTNKKSASLRAAAASVPADRILIEPDCPYMTPHPLRGKQRNEPALIVHTAACLAALRGVPIEELAAQTTANARRLFVRTES
jgi:TatD DNase family protein